MDSVELYGQLLGLTAPGTVEHVELVMAKKHVEVHVGHPAGQRFACSECGRELGVYDHLAERVWRHLEVASSLPTCTHDCRAYRVWSTACIK